MYHGNQGTFHFADGHAEAHKWVNSTIIYNGQQSARGRDVFYFNGPTSGFDYSYIRDRYRHPNWK
jgi:prepilin-type processing-associated H-X9-DG protein